MWETGNAILLELEDVVLLSRLREEVGFETWIGTAHELTMKSLLDLILCFVAKIVTIPTKKVIFYRIISTYLFMFCRLRKSDFIRPRYLTLINI